MGEIHWDTLFLALFERCLEKYRSGNTDFNHYYSEADLAFLRSIGYKPQELFDYVEDHAEDSNDPSISTALLVASVRRSYLYTAMDGELSQHEITPDDLPGKEEALEGIVWLPRIIRKAEAKLRGELDSDIMFGCGGDRPFLRAHNITPEEFLLLIWSAGGDKQKVVSYVQSRAKA